jgi:hypothetical protein
MSSVVDVRAGSLIVDAMTTRASGRSERVAPLALIFF